MTYEEALAYAHEWTRVLISVTKEEHKEKVLMAHKMSIEALEKQIPKKPTEDTEIVGWLVWNCPICGKEVGRVLEGYQHHCECGQAIDWIDV